MVTVVFTAKHVVLLQHADLEEKESGKLFVLCAVTALSSKKRMRPWGLML